MEFEAPPNQRSGFLSVQHAEMSTKSYLFTSQVLQYMCFMSELGLRWDWEEALQLVVSACKLGAKIVDLCKIGDAFVREQTGNMYKNIKKNIETGVAFPNCMSVNNTVFHFSPLASNETVLQEGDVVKIDMGCHIDGFVAVVAHTHVIQDGLLQAGQLVLLPQQILLLNLP